MLQNKPTEWFIDRNLGGPSFRIILIKFYCIFLIYFAYFVWQTGFNTAIENGTTFLSWLGGEPGKVLIVAIAVSGFVVAALNLLPERMIGKVLSKRRGNGLVWVTAINFSYFVYLFLFSVIAGIVG